ncbi:MAG: class I SAM-dependent methyltransferase [Thermodesulfobacteriota bacterium]|nr:class I SAM-dependent methyltransferase [Thermodesulfobacteriota bacterium]
MEPEEALVVPRCTAENLDTFTHRNAILEALKETSPLFCGSLLDVGCGYMPYRSFLLKAPSRVTRYLGLDLKPNKHYTNHPDVIWDGACIPLLDSSFDCAIATEVFEHCPNLDMVLREIWRVLKPGGLLFFTVPFLWPLHNVPNDECRYTPFSLHRHLMNTGFREIQIKALGGWDAAMAQMVGLWVNRRPMSKNKRIIASRLAVPILRYLTNRDCPPQEFRETCMISGLSGRAFKAKYEISTQTTSLK